MFKNEWDIDVVMRRIIMAVDLLKYCERFNELPFGVTGNKVV